MNAYREQIQRNRPGGAPPGVAQQGHGVNNGVVPPVNPPPVGAPPADGALRGGPNVRRLHFVFFLGGDDMKLLLKLVVMVGLFGQNGDQRRWISLISFALVIFIYQLYTNNRNRRRQMENAAARVPPVNGVDAPVNAGQPGVAVGAGGNNDGLNEADAELPPLEMRGLLQGGIAPGGGFIIDIAYFVISFILSMFPGWQPLPVCDPLIVERRRMLELRRAQARGDTDDIEDEIENDEGDMQQPVDAVGGHPHQD